MGRSRRPSGDLRLCATHDRVRRLAGQPAFAWTPGRQFEQDGSRSAYCQRCALERQIDAAAALGLEVYAGYELEWFIGHADAELSPAHHGPVYGPLAMLEVDEFCEQLLADLDANGIVVGQLHAEYGLAQMELAISPLDPLAAADMQLLARQTIHAAARAHWAARLVRAARHRPRRRATAGTPSLGLARRREPARGGRRRRTA